MSTEAPSSDSANGPSDIVRDGVGGFVIPARDPDAIAEKLAALHRDPELRVRMGANAARRAAAFGWSAYVDKVKACLAELCAGPSLAQASAWHDKVLDGRHVRHNT